MVLCSSFPEMCFELVSQNLIECQNGQGINTCLAVVTQSISLLPFYCFFFFFSGPKDVFEMVRKKLLCSELLPDLHCSILSEPFEDDFCKPVT